ncbi:MAG: hypothetical protein B6D64_14260 [Bacteroidetes bacterium 4484_276]|nr:MAG: hypothetical protein B6D64_14260 [Bacteroidetes bacterium 4484_276]
MIIQIEIVVIVLMIAKTNIAVMDNIIRYIEEITGVKIDLVKLRKEEVKNIPFYIMNDYKIWKGKLFEKELLLMEKLRTCCPGYDFIPFTKAKFKRA